METRDDLCWILNQDVLNDNGAGPSLRYRTCEAETMSPTVMDLISAMAEEEKKNTSCSALQAVVSEFSAPEDSG